MRGASTNTQTSFDPAAFVPVRGQGEARPPVTNRDRADHSSFGPIAAPPFAASVGRRPVGAVEDSHVSFNSRPSDPHDLIAANTCPDVRDWKLGRPGSFLTARQIDALGFFLARKIAGKPAPTNKQIMRRLHLAWPNQAQRVRDDLRRAGMVA